MFVRPRNQPLASPAVLSERRSTVSANRMTTNDEVLFTETLRGPILLDTCGPTCALVPKWPITWGSMPTTGDASGLVAAIVNVPEPSDPAPYSALSFLSSALTMVS
jgi:hypothetical protein